MATTTTKRARRGRSAGGRRRAAFALAAALTCAAAAQPGCGARGPLDDTPLDSGAEATSFDAAPSPIDEAGPDARPTGLLACGQCLADTCSGPALACLASAGCRATLACVASSCLASGAPDLGCILRCAGQADEGVGEALEVFECVTSTCGPDCTSVIGALLEGLGGLGGPGTPRDGGLRDAGDAGDSGAADAGDAEP